MIAIVTARLALRPITAEEVSAVLSDQRRSDWATDFPADGDQVIAGLLARAGLPADDHARRFGHRMVIERETGTVVGGIGFFGPPQDGEVEIGYGIVPSRQRRGYATEAVQAMVADILQMDSVRTVTAHVELDNPASVRVLEKSGMTLCDANQEQATYHIRRPSPGRRDCSDGELTVERIRAARSARRWRRAGGTGPVAPG
jgi:[ribosomal protein S5]-alanine N-acetyltransferase